MIIGAIEYLIDCSSDTGTPVERRGRKAMDLPSRGSQTRTARLPKMDHAKRACVWSFLACLVNGPGHVFHLSRWQSRC